MQKAEATGLWKKWETDIQSIKDGMQSSGWEILIQELKNSATTALMKTNQYLKLSEDLILKSSPIMTK